MNARQQILSMIEAQDMIRQVYVLHDGTHAEKELKQLDKQFSKIINILGKMYPKCLQVK